MAYLKNKNLRNLFVLSLLLFSFFGIVFFVFAWQNPTTAPPGGNIMELLNTGTTPQVKTGALTVNGNFVASSTMNVGTSSLWIVSGGDIGIGIASPERPVDIDFGSNTLGMRLHGAAESTEIADIFISSSGSLLISTASSTDTAAYLDFRSNDDQYGYIFRESDADGSTTPYLNVYVKENGAIDYVNFVLNSANSTPGLVISNSNIVSIATTSTGMVGLPLTISGSYGNQSGIELVRNDPTIASTDVIGSIDFVGNDATVDGGAGSYVASIQAVADGNWTTTAPTGLRFMTNDTTIGQNFALWLDSTGNVGVGGDITPTEATLVVGDAGAGSIYATFANAAVTERLCWDASGASLIRDCATSPGDYAEMFGTIDNTLVGGDIVSVDSSRKPEEIVNDGLKGSRAWVVKADPSNTDMVIGIVSTQPNEVIGDNFKEDEISVPVALNGRVPVKISKTSSPIKTGDPITISDIPGQGAKAVSSGRIVGIALENWDVSSSRDRIFVMVNNSYYDPRLSFLNPHNINIAYNPDVDEKAVLKDTDGSLIEKFESFSELIVANLKTGLLEAKKLVVNGIDILKKLEEQDQEIELLKQEVESLKLNR